MTIDSSWIASFKEESPDAFTKHIPFRPAAAFCDGQIRLMRGHTGDFMTWDMYLWQQFTAHIKRFYDSQMVTTVILAFDDYANVPEAKCMTQLKRRRHLPKLEMLEREPLPSFVPSGERWDQSIANRVFKSKVIRLVIERLPGLLQLRPGQTLIVDYAGCPKEFKVVDSTLQCHDLPNLIPMGEADVKFTRYADLYRDLLVDSVDGDSIPIALLHHEACIRELTNGSMDLVDLAAAPPRVCIYRIATKIEKDPPAKKRKAGDDEEDEKKGRPKRTFEYVSIPALFRALSDVCAQCMDRMRSPTHSQHQMSMLLALIGLTGTDYTRGMPQLSGKSVFGLLPDLWLPLMASYDPLAGQMDVGRATDQLVACIYSAKYASHVKTPHCTLSAVLDTLHRSKLSQRTRDSLPSAQRIACTVRNVNWLIRYWREPACVPSPLLQDGGVATFGFVKRRGVVAYACE
jgi:hypothetical protein